jgi:hypothetical protein
LLDDVGNVDLRARIWLFRCIRRQHLGDVFPCEAIPMEADALYRSLPVCVKVAVVEAVDLVL